MRAGVKRATAEWHAFLAQVPPAPARFSNRSAAAHDGSSVGRQSDGDGGGWLLGDDKLDADTLTGATPTAKPLSAACAALASASRCCRRSNCARRSASSSALLRVVLGCVGCSLLGASIPSLRPSAPPASCPPTSSLLHHLLHSVQCYGGRPWLPPAPRPPSPFCARRKALRRHTSRSCDLPGTVEVPRVRVNSRPMLPEKGTRAVGVEIGKGHRQILTRSDSTQSGGARWERGAARSGGGADHRLHRLHRKSKT